VKPISSTSKITFNKIILLTESFDDSAGAEPASIDESATEDEK
jgi:hypothetical protein